MKDKITDYIKGNEIEIEEMIYNYKNYISKIIDNNSKKLISEEDKEEIMSDVFLTVWHNKYKIDPDKNLSHYIAGITKNIVNNHLRQMQKKIETLHIDEQELSNFEDIEILLEQKDILKAIDEELNNLSELDYKIFTKFYYSGKTIREIANELDLKNSNIKVRLYRIRKRVKRGLEKKNIKYRVFLILLMMMMISGITFATIYFKNVFGDNARQGTNKAIQNGYIDNANTEFIESSKAKVSVEYILMDDTSLNLLFNINSEEFKCDSNTKIKLKDMIIIDEEKNIIFCDAGNYAGYEKYCKENNVKYDIFMSNVYGIGYGLNIVEYGENNCKLSYTINSENNPRSKELYIHFSEIEIVDPNYEDNQENMNETVKTTNLIGEWNIKIDIPKEFYERQTYQYKLKSATNNDVTLEYAYITQTCAKIRFSYEKNGDNKVSNTDTEKIIDNALNNVNKDDNIYPYVETSDGKRFNTSHTNDGDGLRTLASANGIYTYYDTFSLTVYDATDEIIAYFIDDEGKKIVLELIKQ